MKPGQAVWYTKGVTRYAARVNWESGGRYSIRVDDPQWKEEEHIVTSAAGDLTARVVAPDSGPQLATPGVKNLGPNRLTERGDAIHRGELEIETLGDIHYVRLYLSIPAATQFTRVDVKKGHATSDNKDVQQDPKTGRILISTGKNSMLWVGAGRPLRAVKWTDKYLAEHKQLAAEARTEYARAKSSSETNAPKLRLQAERHLAEAHRLSAKKSLTPNEVKRRLLRFTQAEKAEQAALLLEKTAREREAKLKLHESITNPLIRAYLFPLEEWEKLVATAVPESANNATNTKTFNVDRHYEPNQYGVQGADLTILRTHVLPRSLITYAVKPQEVDPKTGGEVRDIRELRERLGIPERTLDKPQFTDGGGFAKRNKFAGSADTLSAHYGTWLNSLETHDTRKLNVFLSAKWEKIPYWRRKELLATFLRTNNINPSAPEEVRDFMENVVAPWATQNMIAHVMAEDYDRINKDENVKPGTPFANDFAKWKQDAPLDKKRLETLGRCIDSALDGRWSAKQIVDLVIKTCPELESRYDKISAKTEQYSFYVHAQMVLGQYLKITENELGPRLIPRNVVAKAILFHDMEKVNSKLQYGKEGEHRLTVDELRRYGALFASNEERKIALALVDADPFGDYFKNPNAKAVDTAHELDRIGRALGYGKDRLGRFFLEFHQYYQADFSSYTSAARYTDKDGPQRKGKPVFDAWFRMGGVGGIQKSTTEARLLYSDRDNYEGKFKLLHAEFSKNKIKKNTATWTQEKTQQETALRQRLSDAR